MKRSPYLTEDQTEAGPADELTGCMQPLCWIVLIAFAVIAAGWLILSMAPKPAAAQTITEKPGRPAPSQLGVRTSPNAEPEGKRGDSASNVTERRIREIVREEIKSYERDRFSGVILPGVTPNRKPPTASRKRGASR